MPFLGDMLVSWRVVFLFLKPHLIPSFSPRGVFWMGWVSLLLIVFRDRPWFSSELDFWGPFKGPWMPRFKWLTFHTLDWIATGFLCQCKYFVGEKRCFFVYIIWFVYPLSTKFVKRCREFYEFWFCLWHYTSFSQLTASYTLETSNLPWIMQLGLSKFLNMFIKNSHAKLSDHCIGFYWMPRRAMIWAIYYKSLT